MTWFGYHSLEDRLHRCAPQVCPRRDSRHWGLELELREVVTLGRYRGSGALLCSNTEASAKNDHVNQILPTGVAQVLNKLDGKAFDDADQRLFEVRK